MPSVAVFLLCSGSAEAQGRPAKRVADIVGVALAEYEKGIDSSGRLILKVEFDEAVAFLGQARTSAVRLSGAGADSARLALDSLAAAVSRRVPPRSLDRWRDLLVRSLGADAALDMPGKPVDLSIGKALYAQHCASCHGATAMGDGPAAKGMDPPPPALGSAEVMADVQPALMYRIVSVGIAGTPMAGWSERLSVDERWSIVAYLNGLRAPASGGMATGEGIWLQRCASCHGATGSSDGPMSASLTTQPVEFSSFTWQAERSDVQIASALRDGITGTAMPASRELTAAEVAGVVAFVRTLSLGDAPAMTGSSNPDSVISAVMRRLQLAVMSARSGRMEDADDQAFNAYMEFERIEGRGHVRNPGLIESVERQFADFRAFLGQGDFRSAERSRDAIAQALPAVKHLVGPPLTERAAFRQSLSIILREGFVAMLVIGSVIALLIKSGQHARLKSIWIAVALGLVASGVTELVLGNVLQLSPTTREVVEGVILLAAVPVLFAVCYGMILLFPQARRPGSLRENVDLALRTGGGKALVLVVFLAVFSKSAETALLYRALHNEMSWILKELLGSMVIAAVLLPMILVLFWKYAIKLSWRPFLAMMSALFFSMAFAFTGRAIRDLHEGDVMNLTVLPGWPQVDALGIFPGVEILLAQLVLSLLLTFALLKALWPARSVTLPTIQVVRSDHPELHHIQARLDAIERQLTKINESELATGDSMS